MILSAIDVSLSFLFSLPFSCYLTKFVLMEFLRSQLDKGRNNRWSEGQQKLLASAHTLVSYLSSCQHTFSGLHDKRQLQTSQPDGDIRPLTWFVPHARRRVCLADIAKRQCHRKAWCSAAPQRSGDQQRQKAPKQQ